MATDSGFSNQKKKGLAQFETVQNLGGSKFGKSVAPKAVFEKTPAQAIVSVSDILGSNGQVEFWNIELTAHGALVGDVLRIDDAALKNFEFEIMEVVNVDNVKILPISDVKPTAGMDAIILGWVTSRVDSSGSSIVTSSPIKFVLDGVDTEVLEDTVTPANNKPLPVKLTGFTGDITVTANQLDVSTNSADDSMAIGDPISGEIANVDFNNDGTTKSLKVKDDDANVALTALVDKLPAGLVPAKFDQIVTTYVGATTDIATVVYKDATVTVATLTLTYDGSNRLVDVVRS
jgi:hypothetical protein